MVKNARRVAGLGIASVLVLGLTAPAATASLQVEPPASAAPAAAKVYANCTALNKVYRHGVGRKGAHDRVSGSTRPVTNFAVKPAVYRANKSKDRDGDGIACEKR